MAIEAEAAAPEYVYVGEFVLYDGPGDSGEEVTNPATCGSGTASYDAASNTLTLTNAEITPSPYDNTVIDAHIGDLDYGDLHIVLVGTNTISTGNCGIQADNLEISGSGSLTVTGTNPDPDADTCGIAGTSVTIEDATVTVDADGTGLYGHNGVTITDSTVEVNATGADGRGEDNTAAAIYANGDLTIRNGATVEAAAGCAIYSQGDITIDNAEVEANGTSNVTNSIGICGGNPGSGGNISITNHAIVNAQGTDKAIYCQQGTVTIADSRVTAEGIKHTIGGDIESEAHGLYLQSGQEGSIPTAVIITGASELTASRIQADGDCRGMTITPSDNGSATIEIEGYPYSYEDENGNTVTSPFSTTVTIPANYLRDAGLAMFTSKDTRSASWSRTESPAVQEDDEEVSESHHHHVYVWETYKAATATTDGIMRYRCKYCGTVEYEVPTAAYYVFNKDAQEAIQQAAQGATVTVSTPIFISFHEMVKDALVARPDVTLVVDYRNQGKSYEMTIPAGSGETLENLFGESQFAGFLYLGGAFSTVEK